MLKYWSSYTLLPDHCDAQLYHHKQVLIAQKKIASLKVEMAQYSEGKSVGYLKLYDFRSFDTK